MGFIGVFVGVSISTFLYDKRYQDLDPLPEADAILVLAAGINDDDSLPPTTARRVEAGVRAYLADKAPRLLFSGGRSFPDRTPTATLMAARAVELGVPQTAVLIEDRSRSTLQNGLFSRDILQREGLDDVILVTESYHMGRALISLSWAGVDVVGQLSAGSVFADGPEAGAQLFAREVLATIFNMIRLALWYILGWFGMTDEERLPMLVALDRPVAVG